MNSADSIRTGIFFDHYGGLALGQILHICGPPGSAKTMMSIYLALKFLECFPRGQVLYFDADRRLVKSDIERMCVANSIPRYCLDRIKIDMPLSWSNILDALAKEAVSDQKAMIVIDSLPNIFVEELRGLSENIDELDEEISLLVNNIIGFFENIVRYAFYSKLLVIVINQIRSVVGRMDVPHIWKSLGFIPVFWSIIHEFVDTCVVFRKIRRGLIFARVILSRYMPETIGIIRIDEKLAIR